MNHKEGYKKRYKMYKSGKFWVVAGLFFLGSVVISDVHVYAQESEITTAEVVTEVMEIGDPVTEEATSAKEQSSVLTFGKQVSTVQKVAPLTNVEEEHKNEVNENVESVEAEDFILVVNPIKDTDTVITGIANKNALVTVMDEQGNILCEGRADEEGNFLMSMNSLSKHFQIKVKSNSNGNESIQDVVVNKVEEVTATEKRIVKQSRSESYKENITSKNKLNPNLFGSRV
ncbi:Ig-like domain-containing protein [Vagococcus luciliae]|uniref:Bacterial Ig domain-containing protein n=1 Tax=Vagococcus luciliae TaxID=2920380 RepID=A0ABY5NZ47_9ENTE|nr:Ig-like domain-containing protein [Vagococcus luciliae]UUV98812.1 hypothetical protein G314FT_09660 [Vagococcus luciliae]